MPIYTSGQNVRSGVPLGGLGAGKLEILPSGVLDHFTFLNNLHRPMTGGPSQIPKGIPGFHFCLFVKDKNKKMVKVLQTQPLADYPLVDAIKFNGLFPFVHLEYEDETLPVECSLEAFSPLVPGDEKNSGWPTAIFKFKITNPFSRSMEVALLTSARNLIGEGGVGRFNQVIDTAKALHINFYNKKTQVPGSGVRLLQRNPSFVLEIGQTTVAVDRDITDEIYVKPT